MYEYVVCRLGLENGRVIGCVMMIRGKVFGVRGEGFDGMVRADGGGCCFLVSILRSG